MVPAVLGLGLIGSLPLVSGCGGGVHSMWNTRRQAEAKPLNATTHPPYSGPVFITEIGLLAHESAERIAVLEAGTVDDQPTETVLVMLAEKAREVGANAVVDLKIWRQGSGFSWKAPQGSGLAVRIADTNAVSGLNGYWR
jgi:hypothetical protein